MTLSRWTGRPRLCADAGGDAALVAVDVDVGRKEDDQEKRERGRARAMQSGGASGCGDRGGLLRDEFARLVGEASVLRSHAR